MASDFDDLEMQLRRLNARLDALAPETIEKFKAATTDPILQCPHCLERFQEVEGPKTFAHIVLENARLKHPGGLIRLSFTHNLIMKYLIRHQEHDAPADSIADYIWANAPRRGHLTPTTVQAHIHQMRKKLRPIGINIVHISGYGYKLKLERSDERTESDSGRT